MHGTDAGVGMFPKDLEDAELKLAQAEWRCAHRIITTEVILLW
jgi:hypothetical protein